jgi:hypothetical protein
MKCPECKFVCSELRDICPKCTVDLRSFKRSQGLPVTRPDADYAELLGKLEKQKPVQTATPAAAVTPAKPGSGWLGKLFGDKAAAGPQPATDTAKVKVEAKRTNDIPVEAAVTAVVEDLNVEVEAQIASELAQSDAQTKIPQAQEDLSLESAPEPVKPVSQLVDELSAVAAPVLLKSERDLDDLIDNIIEEAAVTLAEPAVTEIKEQEKFVEEEAAPVVVVESPVVEEAPTVQSEPMAEAVVEVSVPVTAAQQPGAAAGGIDERDLFSAAQRDLLHLQDEAGYQFGLEVFKPSLSGDEIALLFDLSDEYLRNPDSEKVYVEHLLTSDERLVAPSKALDQQVQRTEKILSAPVFTLRHAPDARSSVLPGGQGSQMLSQQTLVWRQSGPKMPVSSSASGASRLTA